MSPRSGFWNIAALCLAAGVTTCGGGASSESARPVRTLAVGIHHRDFWSEQASLDALGAQALRLNFRWVDDPSSPAWSEYDAVVAQNRDKILLVTLGTNNGSLASQTVPKIPETEADIQKLEAFAARVAERYGDAVTYYQLGNEVLVPDNWPCPPGREADPTVCRYGDYARLLARVGSAVRSRDGDAEIVAAGFGGSIFRDANDPGSAEPRPLALYDALAEHATGVLGAIDVHNHHPWDQGVGIGTLIGAYRALHQTRYPEFGELRIVVTENSTWADDPAGDFFGSQSERQQAAYLVASVYDALSAGADLSVFGVLRDGLLGSPPLGDCRTDDDCGEGQACAALRCHESLTVFNLNGLYFDPGKTYTGGARSSGPKLAARTFRAVSWLLEDVPVGGVATDPELRSQGIWRYDVGGGRPHVVVGWSGSGGRRSLTVPAPAGADRVRIVSFLENTAVEWPPRTPLEGFESSVVEAPGGFVSLDLEPYEPVVLLPDQ